MSKEDALHGYCVDTVIKKTAKEIKFSPPKKSEGKLKQKHVKNINKYINKCGEKKVTGEQVQRRHAKKRRMLNMQTTVRGQS